MIDRTPTEERPAPLPIVVTHEAGVRFAAQIGAHQLVLDQPFRGGGRDAGPTPIDLLGAALGACIGLYVHKFLVTRNVADEGLRIEVTQHSESYPHRIARFEVHIEVPGEVPLLYLPMIEAAARVCPAYNTLARAAEVRIAVHAPAGVP